MTLAVQAVRILPIWLCARSVGIDLSLRPFYVMGPVLFFVLLVPFTINGLAVREAFFVSFLGTLGDRRGSGVRRRASCSSSSPSCWRCPASASCSGAATRPGCAAARLDFARLSVVRRLVIVVTYNAMPWLEQCLESVRGHETIVVDHGSTDGTLELVRERFPEAQLVEQENLGLAAGWNTRHARGAGRAGSCSSTPTPGSRRARSSGSSRSPRRIPTRRSSGRGCATRTAVSSAPCAAFRRCGGSRPSTSSCASSRRARGCSTRSTRAASTTTTVREAEFADGRRAARAPRGGRRRSARSTRRFFLFSEETDWCYRFRQAGWKVLFFPGAEASHVGGAVARRADVPRERARAPALPREAPRRCAQAERTRRLLLVVAAAARARSSAASAAGVPRRGALARLGLRALARRSVIERADAVELRTHRTRRRGPPCAVLALAPLLVSGAADRAAPAGGRASGSGCGCASRPRCVLLPGLARRARAALRGISATLLARARGGRARDDGHVRRSARTIDARARRARRGRRRRAAVRDPAARPLAAAARARCSCSPAASLLGSRSGGSPRARRATRSSTSRACASSTRFDGLSLRAVDEFADGGLHPGYAFPLWHGFLALIAQLAGVDPALVVRHEASVLAPLAVLVAYEAGHALFRIARGRSRGRRRAGRR